MNHLVLVGSMVSSICVLLLAVHWDSTTPEFHWYERFLLSVAGGGYILTSLLCYLELFNVVKEKL